MVSKVRVLVVSQSIFLPLQLGACEVLGPFGLTKEERIRFPKPASSKIASLIRLSLLTRPHLFLSIVQS